MSGVDRAAEPDPEAVALHLAELRTAVTPVFGFLEVLGELSDLPADERERMWSIVERRLGDVRELAEQLQNVCRGRHQSATPAVRD